MLATERIGFAIQLLIAAAIIYWFASALSDQGMTVHVLLGRFGIVL